MKGGHAWISPMPSRGMTRSQYSPGAQFQSPQLIDPSAYSITSSGAQGNRGWNVCREHLSPGAAIDFAWQPAPQKWQFPSDSWDARKTVRACICGPN